MPLRNGVIGTQLNTKAPGQRAANKPRGYSNEPHELTPISRALQHLGPGWLRNFVETP